MAVRTNASGEYLRRTANLPSATSFTMCGWAKMTKRAGAHQYWGLEDDTVDAAAYHVIGYNPVGNFVIGNVIGGTAFDANPTNETWFFWAITCSGTGETDFKGYWAYQDDTSFHTVSMEGTSFTPAAMWLGNDSYDEWMNSAYAYARVYNHALTSTELLTEKDSATAVKTTGLLIDSPLPSTSDVTDYSGNGYHWTSAGTLSTEDSPDLGPADPNLDTRSKRASALQLLKPWAMALIKPDNALDQGDRQHNIFTYAGILAQTVASAVQPYIMRLFGIPTMGKRDRPGGWN